MDFDRILAGSLYQETERMHRPLSILMPDEYSLDDSLKQQISSGSYLFPDVLNTGTDKRSLIRTQSVFSAKIHVPNTPLYFHRHDFVELLYMYRGQCKQYIENLSDCLVLREGDIFLLNQKVTHGLLQEDSDAVLIKTIIPVSMLGHEFICTLQGEQAKFWSDAISPQQEYYYYMHYSGGFENERLFVEQLMEEYYLKEQHSEDACRCWLQLLLIALERREGVYHSQRLTKSTMEMGRIIQYVYEHSENVTLETLANHFSYSPSHLSRAIKESCQMTFHDLLRDCRMEKAAALLTSSKLSIEEIAANVGYRNAESIYEGIKEKFGISPGEYRKRYGQMNG